MNGLFSSNANVVTSPAQLMANASRDLFTGLFNVGGMATPEQQVLGIMKDVDPTDLNSVKQAFRDIMNISPEAAVEFKNQMLPFIKSQQEEQRLAAQMIPKPKERKTVQQNGVHYYADTGERVLPGVADKIKDEDKPRDLPQMNKAEKERITELVDNAFDFGLFDAWFTGQTDAPEGFSEKALVDFVFSYSQINNVPAIEVIRGIAKGTIDPKQPISTVAPSSTNNNNEVPTVRKQPVSR